MTVPDEEPERWSAATVQRRATLLAAAVVTGFLRDDPEAIEACLRESPVRTEIAQGLLRFAALAVTEAAATKDMDPVSVAQLLTDRLALLEH